MNNLRRAIEEESDFAVRETEHQCPTTQCSIEIPSTVLLLFERGGGRLIDRFATRARLSRLALFSLSAAEILGVPTRMLIP